MVHKIAGWSSQVARQAHNLKAAGSNPAPATPEAAYFVLRGERLFCIFKALRLPHHSTHTRSHGSRSGMNQASVQHSERECSIGKEEVGERYHERKVAGVRLRISGERG